ncbi:hypothetical protein EDI_096090 [Entamoeba dispar SAW760]|uniref:Uncharacterized protein n=1 Tax=Entamoeba dispar (strain ATCC PRA-260 / SAW760) TaxID=370354 RepID=B0EPP7_ENTDS|nr:uncharacterized protein EDI_096090 [Entamoeba dispar SAW760]EDR23477.1 hypothetical protein EDI_096090 [Entamoeba dispar SAW760]|eukprot:EDR23477.1 hypothetical protein EDI_096090 [Entamoeba dispar SAW760]
MKITLIFGILMIVMAVPIHICTDHLQAVEDSILSAETHISDIEDIEKETLDDIDSAFGDIRNSICKADFVRTAHIIEVLKEKLLRVRQIKSKWVKVLQNTVNALPPHLQHKILFKNKIENRMRMNPDFISIADIPSIPVYEGMPKYAPVITKIADGMMEEIEDIKTDEQLILLQEKYEKVQSKSKESHLKTQKVLEGIDAIMVSIRLGRIGIESASTNYNKLFKLLKKTTEQEKRYISEINSLRKQIFDRKRSILQSILDKGRVIQKDMVQNRIQFLKKMSSKYSSNKLKETNQRLNSLINGIQKQWKQLQEQKIRSK